MHVSEIIAINLSISLCRDSTRTCTTGSTCYNYVMEDESHFLFTCTKYERERDILKIKLMSAGYEGVMNPTCMRNLFEVDNADMVYAIGNYIHRCMNMRS